jgi:hypothetical protein
MARQPATTATSGSATANICHRIELNDASIQYQSFESALLRIRFSGSTNDEISKHEKKCSKQGR